MKTRFIYAKSTRKYKIITEALVRDSSKEIKLFDFELVYSSLSNWYKTSITIQWTQVNGIKPHKTADSIPLVMEEPTQLKALFEQRSLKMSTLWMRIFQETKCWDWYWLLDVAEKPILKSKYFNKDETDPNNSSHRNSVFHIEIQEAKYLTGNIKIDLKNRVIPVVVYQLLKEEGRSDLRFYVW